MEIKYFGIVVLCFFATICNSQSMTDSNIIVTDKGVNHQQSKLLIKRYNKVRQAKKMNDIIQDTALDNICRKLIKDKSYRNIDNTFKEDSIRSLLYESGLIDYQYEIKEVTDKDTTATFNSFLLAENSSKTRMGYIKNANKHILFKTKSFIKYGYCIAHEESEEPQVIGGVETAKIKTTSVIFHIKTSVPGKYFYQLYDHIPLSTERKDTIKKYEVQSSKICDNLNMYDIEIQSTYPNTVFLILNTNNERISVIKY